jgi:hypothetical protein
MDKDRQSPDDAPRYWFPAKRFGWGWGFPCVWQGWVVMHCYLLLLILPGAWIDEDGSGVPAYVAWAFVITALLIWICWRKGEPTRWRWGDD